MAQLVGPLSCTPKGRGFDPGQGTYLGCGFDPWTRQLNDVSLTSIFLSLSLSPLFLPLSRINNNIPQERIKKINKQNSGRRVQGSISIAPTQSKPHV